MAKRQQESSAPPTKRHKHTGNSILHGKFRKLNSIPSGKSTPMDIFVWGTGSMCELGLGPLAKNKEVKRPRKNALLSNIVDFSVGGMHTLAVDFNSTVFSWGTNDCGALGRDTSTATEKLRDMDADSDDDDGDLNELESTPYPVEGLPAGVRVVQLCATDNLSAALLENGQVWAWGTYRCNEGVLGFKHYTKMQRTPVRVDEFKNIVQLAAGKDHILGLDERGVVFAWGNGQQGQLGRKVSERSRLRTLEPREFGLTGVKFIGSGEFHCFAITEEGKVLSWGLNQFGQCGISSGMEDGAVIHVPTEIEALTGKDIVSITGGEHHSIALASDGSVYTFGRIDMFEVGIKKDELPESTYRDEHGKPRSVPEPTKLKLRKCKYVTCGSHHTLAVTEDGVAFSWGFGETYAVGLGPAGEDIEVPTRIKNTATQNYNIMMVGAGGQFSVSGGVELTEEQADEREDIYEEE